MPPNLISPSLTPNSAFAPTERASPSTEKSTFIPNNENPLFTSPLNTAAPASAFAPTPSLPINAVASAFAVPTLPSAPLCILKSSVPNCFLPIPLELLLLHLLLPSI